MPQKNKILSTAHGIGIILNNILGSGIVTAPGIIWRAVKSPFVVLILWLIGGIASMAGSLTYAELGAMHKVDGGEAKYLYTAFPNPKFMMSYIFSFINIFAIRPGIMCAILQSAAQYFWYTVKGYQYDLYLEQDKNGWQLSFSPFWVIKLIATGFLLVITAYHILLSNRWANYINQTLGVIKLITYSIIAIIGIIRLFTHWPSSHINWQQPLSGDSNIKDYSTSILLVLFSYDGWNSLNYSLDEFQKPEKNLIFSNSISVGIATIVYLAVNVAFISVVPGDVILHSDKTDETIVATFFHQLFNGSEVVVRIFTGLVVLSIIGTAASQVWSGSRVIVAVAELKFFPAYSKELRVWNEYFDTPVNALLAQFIWCSFIIIFIGSSFTVTSFTFFSIFSMYNYWIFYLATGIGLLVIRFRSNQPQNSSDSSITEKTETSSKKYFRVPIPVAIIFILTGLYVLTFSFVVGDDDRIQKMTPIFISYGFLFIAIIFWLLWYYLYYKERKKPRPLLSR